MLGRELSRNGRENTYDSAPDPLLSPFICSISFQDPNSLQKDELSDGDVAVTADVKRYTFSVKSQSVVLTFNECKPGTFRL